MKINNDIEVLSFPFMADRVNTIIDADRKSVV